MRLATLRDGSLDGCLVVVSRDLTRAVAASAIAPNLLDALQLNPNSANDSLSTMPLSASRGTTIASRPPGLTKPVAAATKGAHALASAVSSAPQLRATSRARRFDASERPCVRR